MSAISQTHECVEILVIDDGSTDETPDVVEELTRSYSSIQLLRQSNLGPGAARQKGIDGCTGEFIQFLDSDDLLVHDKFEKQISELRDHPECGVCYGQTISYPLGGVKCNNPVKWTGRKIDSMFPSFLTDRWWDTSTPLYRSEIVKANGPWLHLRQEEDWEFDCRLAARGVQLARVESVVSETRVLPGKRLSLGGSSNRALLADRCAARMEILQHAIAAGIDKKNAHMLMFLAGSFLVARQAALTGAEHEADALLKALNDFDRDYMRRLFRQVGKTIGLRRLTRVAESGHALINGLRGRS